jgi:ribonucleoside-diphosphate reductase beta chain
MARTIDDIVREVESADVQQLQKVDVEDVYQQMDHMLESRPSPLELYNRWEKQQWAVADLDFTQDKEHWANLKQFPGIGDQLQGTWTLFFIGEQAVTDTLGPIVHAAPTEEDRIFLSTQIVDEARHTVFFMRFFDEVLGISGGLSGALNAIRPEAVAGFQKIFDVHLAGAVDDVRRNPTDYEAWIRGITTYHLVVEGMLALTGQKFILRTIRQFDVLPGFYAGFTAVTRDESRHVNWGVGAIREAVAKGLGGEVEKQISELLEPACWTILAPDRDIPFEDPEAIPEDLQINPLDIIDFSLQSLTKRLKVAGISKEFCDSVTERGKEYYANGITEFEERFNKEHPLRWWQRKAAS